MARLIKFLVLILCFFPIASYGALRGNVEYTIPIEYKNLSESELEAKAEIFYNKALQTKNGKINDDISQSLVLYTVLENKNPQNIIYPLRVGRLYQIIGKDRYAKGNFYRAMGISPSRPEPYFYLGEYYYSKQLYRRALKMYKRASEHGYSKHHQTNLRLKQIYLMLGDTKEYSKI